MSTAHKERPLRLAGTGCVLLQEERPRPGRYANDSVAGGTDLQLETNDPDWLRGICRRDYAWRPDDAAAPSSSSGAMLTRVTT